MIGFISGSLLLVVCLLFYSYILHAFRYYVNKIASPIVEETLKLHFTICYWSGDWRSVPRLYREIRSLFPDVSIALVPDGLTPLPTTIEPLRLKPIDGNQFNAYQNRDKLHMIKDA